MLEEIIGRYEKLLKTAQKNRWDEVQKIEPEIRDQLNRFFDTFNNENLTEEELEELYKIESMNDKLLDMARNVKNEFIDAAADSLKMIKAAQGYEKYL